MSSYPNSRLTPPLGREHRHMLFEESAISGDVAAERGYKTVRSRAELLEFSKKQRKLGLYVPTSSPDGVTTSAQIRPNKPGKGPKYMSPKGSTPIADVHPRMMDRVRQGSEDLYITEGAKTADSMTSRDLPTVMLAGVWNWKVKGTHDTLIPCFDHIALEGRTVHVCFDADAMRNPNVQQALERFAPALEARGATVRAIYLPDPESKTGADDYFAAGYSVSEFKMLSRRYEPADIGKLRLSQDDKLKAAIDSAWASWFGFDWNRVVGTGDRPHWMRGHSCRDIEHAAIERATKSGVQVEDGVYFTFDIRSWAESSATNKDTVKKSIPHLMAEGRLRREKPPEDGRAAGYVLLTARATSVQIGATVQAEGADSLPRETSTLFVRDLRAPRLRWSAPKFSRNPDGGWDREFIRRLGKHNGAIIDYLDSVGGSATVADIAETLHKRRTRDVRRRNIEFLVERGIVAVDGDTVSLVDGWLGALAEEQHISGEIEAATIQRQKHQHQREAYRNRDKHPADPSPTQAEMDARREEPDTDPAAEFIAEELAVASGVRIKELAARWADTGGNKQDLKDAIKAGPYTVYKEEMDFDQLYIYHRSKSPRKAAA